MNLFAFCLDILGTLRRSGFGGRFERLDRDPYWWAPSTLECTGAKKRVDICDHDLQNVESKTAVPLLRLS